MKLRVTGAVLALATGISLVVLGIVAAVAIANEPETDATYVPNFIAGAAAFVALMPFAAAYLTCAGFLLKGGPTARAGARIGITVTTAVLLIPALASLISRPLAWHLTLLLPISATTLLWLSPAAAPSNATRS